MMIHARIGALFLLSIAAAAASAESYMAGFDRAQWQVQRSPLVCRLTQTVPRFGEASFETVGAGPQRFVLRAAKNPLEGGPAQLTAVAPSWNAARAPLALGPVEISDGGEALQLGGDPAVRLLESLQLGLVPTLARPLRDNAQVLASVALSPVNFAPAYRQYSECRRQLLPVTFDSIQNTIIEFPLAQSELSAAAQKKIDFLLRYIAIDRSVTRFEIRGVSSDNVRRLENLQLAKQRAQQVSEYLMSRGIDAAAIESSYQGDRGSNGDRSSNNARRFVSIRLKRGGAVN